MVHTFFFLMSFLTDYQAMSEAFRDGSIMGLLNACLFLVAGTFVAIRAKLSLRTRNAPRTSLPDDLQEPAA